MTLIQGNAHLRRQYIVAQVAAGKSLSVVSTLTQEKYGIDEATFAQDIASLGKKAREFADSEEAIDLLVAAALTRLRTLTARMAALTELDVEILGALSAKDAEAITRVSITAAKEVRACIELEVNLLGRRSKRWTPRSVTELDLHDGSGTLEQQEAVRRLLGLPAEAPALPDGADGAYQADGAYRAEE